MKTLTKLNNISLLLFSAVVVGIFLILVVMVLMRSDFVGTPNLIEPKSGEEIADMYGDPLRTESSDSLEKRYFPSKYEYEDQMVFEKQEFLYAVVNIFDEGSGYLSDYIKKNGQPDIEKYEAGDEHIRWHIFTDVGLGIATFTGESEKIAKIIHFNPQDEKLFLETIGEDLGLTDEQPRPEVLIPSGNPIGPGFTPAPE